MKKVNLILFFCFGITFSGLSQSGGIRIYTGATLAKNRVQQITPESTQHTGYHFGADGRLNGGGMFFNVGVRYTKIDLVAQSGLSFFEVKDIHEIFSIRGGLGFYLYRNYSGIAVRSKLLASMDLNQSYTKEAIIDNSPFDQLNEGGMGGIVGLSFDWNSITFDLEYEHGFIHTYREQKESKSDNWSLSVGFFF